MKDRISPLTLIYPHPLKTTRMAVVVAPPAPLPSEEALHNYSSTPSFEGDAKTPLRRRKEENKKVSCTNKYNQRPATFL